MPVDIQSETWQNGNYFDNVHIHIEDFLRSNPNSAYSLDEIADYIIQNHDNTLPSKLLTQGSPNEVIHTLIFSRLDELHWYGTVDSKVIEEEIYYTYTGDGCDPLIEINIEIPERIDSVEKKFEREIKELEERVSYNEYKITEEHGMY